MLLNPRSLEGFRVETDRLFLMPIDLTYAEEIFNVFDDTVTKYMYPSTPEKIEVTINFIKGAMEHFSTKKDVVAVILHKDTMEFLGCVGLHDMDTNTPELGIWTKTSIHGNRYGREAVKGMKEWADRNVSYEYLIYPVAEENIPSRKIPESLGGVLVSSGEKANQASLIHRSVTYHIYPTK